MSLDEPIYTVHEVAERLKVSEGTVKTWIWKEQLRAYDVSGVAKKNRNWRVKESDLNDFLERRQNGGPELAPVGPGWSKAPVTVAPPRRRHF